MTNPAPTHLRRATLVACMLAVTLLGACSTEPEPGTLTAVQEEEARRLRQQYDAALTAHDFNGATKIADRLRKKYPDSEAMVKVRATLDDTIARADAQNESARLAAMWEYQAIPAAGGTQYTALLPSHVERDENGVPAGPSDAKLVLRAHPEWGRSVYLILAQQRFACGTPCTVQIAFDDLPAASFVGEQADSGNGPALFIEERERFYAAMRDADTVTITLPKTVDAATPKLRFDVGGYEASRLGTDF